MDSIANWITNQKDLIDLERKEEEEQLLEIMATTTLKELETLGLCFNNLKISKTKYSVFNKILVTFVNKKFDNMKKHIEKNSDNVILFW